MAGGLHANEEKTAVGERAGIPSRQGLQEQGRNESAQIRMFLIAKQSMDCPCHQNPTIRSQASVSPMDGTGMDFNWRWYQILGNPCNASSLFQANKPHHFFLPYLAFHVFGGRGVEGVMLHEYWKWFYYHGLMAQFFSMHVDSDTSLLETSSEVRMCKPWTVLYEAWA